MATSYGAAGNGGIRVVMGGQVGTIGSAIRIVEIPIPVSLWKGAASPYSQVVEVEGISVRSKIDLLPNHAQLESLRDQRITFIAENSDGVVTIYAVGDKPDEDLVFQAAVSEVVL